MLQGINITYKDDKYVVYGAPTKQIENDIIALSAYWTDITVTGNYKMRDDTFEIYDIFNEVTEEFESKEAILDAYYHAGMPDTLKIFNRGSV